MKKSIVRMFIILVTIILFFLMDVNGVKALDTCDFGNNYGTLETRTQKVVAKGLGSTKNGTNAYNMQDSKIPQLAYDWSSPEYFYWVYAAEGGYIKSAKFTVYSDDGHSTELGDKRYNGKKQCEYSTDVVKLCKAAEGQEKCETFKYVFSLTKKHIYMIEFEGTYVDANGKEQSFKAKKFLVYKKDDGYGIDHVAPPAGEPTTTPENKHIDSGSELDDGAAAGTKKGGTKVLLKTNADGEIINSSATSCTEVSDLIHDYWKYVMVIVPILLIVMMTLDFFKAVGKGDSESIKKAGNNTVKRAIAAVVLLALPALLGLIFSWFGLELCL